MPELPFTDGLERLRGFMLRGHECSAVAWLLRRGGAEPDEVAGWIDDVYDSATFAIAEMDRLREMLTSRKVRP